MKKKKVIDRKNLPARHPLGFTILCFLALDYWNAPAWLLGAVGVIVVFMWVAFFMGLASEDEVDIFDEKAPLIDQFEEQSKFNQKLQELKDKKQQK